MKRRLLNGLTGLLLSGMVWAADGALAAANAATAAEPAGSVHDPELSVQHEGDGVFLSTQLDIALPPIVQDALRKGIPMHFVAIAELLQERWYWVDKLVALSQRRMRLAYHPLTQRWRLQTGLDEATAGLQGLTLDQDFETLESAVRSMGRFARWQLAESAAVKPGAHFKVAFQFYLDTGQLPRPLQFGGLGSSDWKMHITLSQPLAAEPAE